MASKEGEDMESKLEKLDMLLHKTTAYTQFLSDKLTSSNVYGAAVQPLTTTTTTTTPSENTQPEKKGRGRKPKQSETKDDKTLGEKVDVISTPNTKSTIYSQPALVEGGSLRKYQLEGVNWMIGLWENGMNGILADEMGLGKTIQVISFIAHLWEKGVQGPFLIVAPLSTLQNWVNEFNKWTPSVPVMLYHATKEERGTLRNKLERAHTNKKRRLSTEQTATKSKGRAADDELPVLITSYDIAINDRKYLQRHKWKYLVVDEAHRLKNFECKLICELRQLDTENRLLLTGTPLQNNLTELWSLLNFILPQIFDDLTSFQKWFDFTEVLEASTVKDDGPSSPSSTSTTSIAPQDQTSPPNPPRHRQLVSKLHSILRPFLLRRLKTDVEIALPKKREFILYCSMTPPQATFYNAVKTKAFTNIGVRLSNILMHLRKVCNHPFLFDSDLTGRYLDPDASVEEVLDSENGTEDTAPTQGRGRRIRKKVDYSDEMIDEAEEELTKEDGSVSPVPSNGTKVEPKKKVAKTAYGIFVREQWNKIKASASTNTDSLGETNAAIAKRWKALPEEEKAIYAQKLMDEQLLVQNIADSSSTDRFEDPEKYMQSLLQTCGKLQLLDKMLPTLKQKGHKVLIFSQMTKLLDLLEEYFEVKKYQYCRIDGTISQPARQAEIDRFNNDGDVFIFLLSTRAGGVGINLASADTVIIYDSDWNPQSDKQAQDRAHRIGQTKPVVIYRLITAGTVEERILQRAQGKLRLESLVIKKGNFKELINNNTANKILSMDDMSEIIQMDQGDSVGSVGGISDEALKEVLDRKKCFEASSSKEKKPEEDERKGGYEVVEESTTEF